MFMHVMAAFSYSICFLPRITTHVSAATTLKSYACYSNILLAFLKYIHCGIDIENIKDSNYSIGTTFPQTYYTQK